MEFLDPSEDSIDLESESPPLWLSVVLLKHINVLTTQILPIGDRLFNPFGFRHLLPQDLKEGGFTTSNVSFDGEAVISSLELRVESFGFKILIQTSR